MSIFIHKSSIIESGAHIGEGTKVWHWVHVCENAEIGKNCVLGQNVYVGPGVKIGDNVRIQNNVSVFSGVQLEDDVFCGPSVVFTNVINPRSLVERKDQFRTTVVKKGASLGANSTIVCGNELGEYSFVGAGAVVTTSVKPYSLVVGVPAVMAGWISECGNRLDFSRNSIAVCPESGDQYELSGGIVAKLS